MPNTVKTEFIELLQSTFGSLRKLPGSDSLFANERGVQFYLRYSRLHDRARAFFGLRQIDLARLQGTHAYICLLTTSASSAVFLPYDAYEQVFASSSLASDGQYKIQLLDSPNGVELYVPKQGRFNVEAHVGLESLNISEQMADGQPALGHTDVQVLLAEIGHAKGYDIYLPANDLYTCSHRLAGVNPRRNVPGAYGSASQILAEIDVLWLKRGREEVVSLFEVEHTTTIYSGLLRFNDVLITNPTLMSFCVVADDRRRDLFVRQLRRPTFVQSGLADRATFLDYGNVYAWRVRIGHDAAASLNSQ
jgi:hypothetical protein